MKTTVLVLAFAFGALQTVGFVDCCCGTTCEHQNECQGCEKENRSVRPAAPDLATHACCPEETCPGSGQPRPETGRCAHFEPSSEVTAQVPPVIAGLFAGPGLLDRDPAPLIPIPHGPASAPRADFAPVGPGVPLTLFESVLQI
ncbi:MAG TPA: hypothetical protein VEN81_01020 [Planctomycetota bacterium]|nr:hypothetical protein [Planctomycetota bacterium]